MPVHAASLADLADLVPLFSAYLDFYEVPAPEEQVRAFLAGKDYCETAIQRLTEALEALE